MNQYALLVLALVAGASAIIVALLRMRQGSGSVSDRLAMLWAGSGRQALPWYRTRGRPGMFALGLIGFLGVLLLLMNLGVLRFGQAAPSGAFVVRIAPFEVQDGSPRTGMIVATQLRDELKRRLTTPVDVDVLRQQVTSPEAALEAAQQSGAEVVIWGVTLEGGSATSPTLRPRLTWLPNDPWKPRDWQGYDGHLVLPQDYDLARSPLNGAAVLPGLIEGLALFSRGDADRAAERLAALERDYEDVLREELPSAIRAVIFWAQGLLPDSIAEARRALAAAPRAEHWNNLGALLLDQQQHPEARAALLQAVAADPRLITPRLNLGRLAMNEEHPADALPDLRTAAQIDDRPVVLATLAEALRRSGELEHARQALDQVLVAEPNNGPALVERALLALTPVHTTSGPIEWELERTSQRTAEQLDAIRTQAQRGVALIEALRAEDLRSATGYGAAGRPEMQRLMEMQARRLEEELIHRRYQLVVVMIEQGRLSQGRPRSSVVRLWDALRGKRTPLQEAAILADAVARQSPGGVLQYGLLYQQGRAAYLGGDARIAKRAWDAADALAVGATDPALATRPEAAYGQARLLLDGARRPEASAELERALAADERFYPARRLLATIAEEDRRWADAEPHLRWLAEHRPAPAITIELATALREQGRLPEAEALLLPLANNDDADSLVLLARMYREAGQLDAAGTALERALEAAPTSAAALEEQALVELARPDPRYDVVENVLRRAIAADPSRTSAHIELGKLLANVLGRPGDAARSFQAAVELKSDDPVTYRDLGETLLESGAPQAAEESFKRALRLNPASHETHHGLATAYLAQGRLDLAEGEERKALDLAGGNYTLALVGLGDIARARANYDEALVQYGAALERDPVLAVAYLGLGDTAAARGEWAIARGHYQRGLDANPDNLLLLLALGKAQLAGQDANAALAAFERARQLAPTNAATYAGVGRALWALGRLDEALDQLSAAVQRNPNDAEAMVDIGGIYAARQMTDQALAAYEQAAKVRKGWYEPHFRRGVLLLTAEQPGPALDALRTAVRLNQDYAPGHYWVGRAYRAASDYANAARELRRAVELQPDFYEARFFLGRTLDEQGSGDDAVAVYSAIIAEAPAGDPWRTEAERELDRIR